MRVASPLRPGMVNRMRTVTVIAIALTLATSMAACGSDSKAVASGLDTLRPGVITVAVQPYMPYTGTKAGKLQGLDSEILQSVAKKLDLTIEVQVTDFNGMLGSVQSRRVDISIGGIAWTKERSQQGLFTDPPYYSPPALATHGNQKINTVADLQGRALGTVTGYVWAKSIKAVPNADPHTYPDANGVFSDLGSGRLDVGFLDPLLITYTQRQRPDLGIKTRYLQPPTAAEVAKTPDYAYFQPYMTGFYLPTQEPKLAKAISDQLDVMYHNGELSKLITKWGGDPEQFLKPADGFTGQRRAVDRPGSWTAPTL